MIVLGIVGWSGSGKTTLIEAVIPHLVAASLDVATVKHAHHRFDMDRPGKDSYRHRAAGARQTLVVSDTRWALLTEEAQPPLADLIGRLAPADIVLVEGYRGEAFDKLEVWREERGGDVLYPEDNHIQAVISDTVNLPAPLDARPLLPLGDPEAVAHYIKGLTAGEAQ